ncbi:LysE family translocator [Dactylosporangium sucinum]|nr:LysE family translocator [Dactylosporangium sucinum]
MTPRYDPPLLLALPEFFPAVHVGPVGTLVLASLVIMGSPGPSTISLVAAAVAYGVRRSLAYCVGLIVGTTVVLLGAATGVTAVLLAAPTLRWVLVIAAAGYILWLAYQLATAPPLAEQTASDRRPSFADGLVLGVINPKAWIAIAAVFASVQLASTAAADALLKIPLLTLMVILIHAMWLLAARLFVPALSNPGRARAVNITLAGLLILATVPALLL